MERKHQVIESLLAKPSSKPDFSAFPTSNILKRAQEFMPKFIQTTDRLLADPDLLKENQMDIRVMNKDLEISDQSLENEIPREKLITMDIGVGVYDIYNEDFNEKEFKASSTEPIVKIKGCEPSDVIDGSESSGSSDDSELFYEFSSGDESEAKSHTTKSTIQNKQQKKPLIQDITPLEEQKDKQTLNKKKNKKRKHA